MIYAQPSGTYTAVLNAGIAGLVGKVKVQLENGDGTTAVPATAAGIVEVEPTVYAKDDLVAPDTAGTYIVVWDVEGERAAEELVVTYDLPEPAGGTPEGDLVYAAVGDFKTYVSDRLSLDDETIRNRLREAQRDIDLAVGPIPVDMETGLKFIPDELEADDRAALVRATCAQAEYRVEMGPAFFRRPQFNKTKGPDYETEGQAPIVGPAALRELTYSRLMRLTAATGDRRPAGELPPWHDSLS